MVAREELCGRDYRLAHVQMFPSIAKVPVACPASFGEKLIGQGCGSCIGRRTERVPREASRNFDHRDTDLGKWEQRKTPRAAGKRDGALHIVCENRILPRRLGTYAVRGILGLSLGLF